MISHGLIEAEDSHGGSWTDGVTGIAGMRRGGDLLASSPRTYKHKGKPNKRPMVIIQTMKTREMRQLYITSV